MSSKDILDDFLDEDPEIQGQKWALVSFLSPERVLEEKSQFFFRKFLSSYELKWKTTRLEAWMATQLQQINDRINEAAGELRKKELNEAADEVEKKKLNVADFVQEFHTFTKNEFKSMSEMKMREEYEDFLFKEQEKLEDEFHTSKDFQTTIRGIKIRGVFATESEAAARARRLQKTDKLFNIYAASVGKWTPWDPDPNKIANQEYAQEQLNTLMKKYNENNEARDQFYEEQKKQRMAKKNAEAEGKALPPMEVSVMSDGPAPAPAPTSDAAPPQLDGSSYDGMFSGPADLVIARKEEAAAAAAAVAADSEKKE